MSVEAVGDSRRSPLPDAVLRPVRMLPTIAYWPVDAFTAGLLPPSLRLAFGMPFRTRERVFFRVVIVALRHFLSLVPDRIRVVPQARGYEARLR